MQIMEMISRAFYKVTGWRIEGNLPPEVKKCVMVAAPHTSNWDFPYARAAFYMLHIKVNYLVKQEVLNSPLGGLMKALGGIGVDRGASANLVSALARKLKEADELVMLISPEGTRSLTHKWKTGFYQAALQANVPIVMSFLDYKRRIAGIGLVIHPTGDFIKDMQPVLEFYRGITPARPNKYVLQIY